MDLEKRVQQLEVEISKIYQHLVDLGETLNSFGKSFTSLQDSVIEMQKNKLSDLEKDLKATKEAINELDA